MSRAFHSAWIPVLLVLLMGCQDPVDPPVTIDEATVTAEAESAEPADSEAVEVAESEQPSAAASKPVVQIAPWDEIMQTVTSSGKPAVLDVWSLVCQPCLKEFPGLVRLHKEHGEKVACYSADVDFDGRKTRPPESYRPRVEEFLKQVEAAGKFPHFISSTSSDEVYSELDIDSIPTVVVFAADGTIAKKFVDAGETAGFTYEKDVIPFVESMLNE